MRLSLNDPFRIPDGWPSPDPDALVLGQRLVDALVTEIRNNQGQIGFDKYMGMALYEPGLGYYSGGQRKFGSQGDFTTAPEISSLFSACVARQCEQIFDLSGSRTILELGAGTGIMASDILSDLQRRSSLPDSYIILETSADLRQRQQERLNRDHPGLTSIFRWVDTLPTTGIKGVIIANEVLDAIPVCRIKMSDGEFLELKVIQKDNGFCWDTGEMDDALADSVKNRLGGRFEDLDDGYTTEINVMLPGFLRSLSETLDTGVILLFDYGYTRSDYYHPQRNQGTLICHYRHRSHENPLILPGIQDISAFVDFTTVAESAHDVGLDVSGYTTQAGFLLSVGLDQVLRDYADGKQNVKLSKQAGELVLPGGMGERFKMMALSRGINSPLDGLKELEQTARL